MSLEISPDRAVSIRYDMRTTLPDGTVKERRGEKAEFIYGIEAQVPSLEGALLGAVAGDRFNVNVPPEELYGERDPELIREIPKAGLIRQRIKEGQYYRQMKGGCLISFKILRINPDTVVADFNKPMAGISVSLEGEVISVREADQKEIDAAREAETKRMIGCG